MSFQTDNNFVFHNKQPFVIQLPQRPQRSQNFFSTPPCALWLFLNLIIPTLSNPSIPVSLNENQSLVQKHMQFVRFFSLQNVLQEFAFRWATLFLKIHTE